MNTCDSCGIVLADDPAPAGPSEFCCSGCGAGGPCVCTYEKDLGRFPPSHYARAISLADLLDRYETAIQKCLPGGQVRIRTSVNDEVM